MTFNIFTIRMRWFSKTTKSDSAAHVKDTLPTKVNFGWHIRTGSEYLNINLFRACIIIDHRELLPFSF